MNFTDEQLSAFLDGELDKAEMDYIRAALSSDEDQSEQLEELAFINSLIISKYEEIDSRPLPSSVVDLLANNSNRPVRLIVSLKSLLAKFKVKPLIPFIALTIATIATIATIMIILPTTQPDKTQARAQTGQQLASGSVPHSKELHSLLSNSPSSLARQFGAGSERQFNAILSFKNHSDQFCREFTIREAGTMTRSVACLSDGGWTILAASNNQARPINQQYQTASTLPNADFESYIDSIIASAPMSQAEELERINSHWEN